MDVAMRDLEQIQERADANRGRQVGIFVLGGVALAGLIFAMSTVVGDATHSAQADVPDPLARLDETDALSPKNANVAAPAKPLSREEMTFPNTLVDDPHSELAAALARAAAEQANPDPIVEAAAARPALPTLAAMLPTLPSLGVTNAAPSSAPTIATIALHPAQSRAAERALAPRVSPRLPASSAAGNAARFLDRAPAEDPLLSHAATATAADSTTGEVASSGTEGAYTVQVISYDQRADAEAFAQTLRERGHHAFITNGDVAGRDRMFRVRIGPFETVREAEGYAKNFEAHENMHTLVVRRATDARTAAE